MLLSHEFVALCCNYYSTSLKNIVGSFFGHHWLFLHFFFCFLIVQTTGKAALLASDLILFTYYTPLDRNQSKSQTTS